HGLAGDQPGPCSHRLGGDRIDRLATLTLLTPTGLELGWAGVETVLIGVGYVFAVVWIRRGPPRSRHGGPADTGAHRVVREERDVDDLDRPSPGSRHHRGPHQRPHRRCHGRGTGRSDRPWPDLRRGRLRGGRHLGSRTGGGTRRGPDR